MQYISVNMSYVLCKHPLLLSCTQRIMYLLQYTNLFHVKCGMHKNRRYFRVKSFLNYHNNITFKPCFVCFVYSLGISRTIIGFTFIVARLRYSPWCSIMPWRNIFQRMLHPSCVSVELMNRACFSNASAWEQIEPESSSLTSLLIVIESKLSKRLKSHINRLNDLIWLFIAYNFSPFGRFSSFAYNPGRPITI